MDSAPVATVRRALLALGARDTVTVFDDDVPTAATAAAALGCELGAVANSLIFEADGAPLLVLASGAARVDARLLARTLGTGKIRRAGAEFVLEHTGQHIGGVAPVGHPAPIRSVLDAALRRYPLLWARAGDDRSMFSISFAELQRITGAAVTVMR